MHEQIDIVGDHTGIIMDDAAAMKFLTDAQADSGYVAMHTTAVIDDQTRAIRNQTKAVNDLTNAEKKNNNSGPRTYDQIIKEHDTNRDTWLSRELDDLRKTIERRDKDTRFGQLAGQNIVHSSSTYAGFLKTDRGYSRIPLSTFLRSENFGHGGKNIVKGTSISDEYRQLFELAGITLGGSAKDAISKFNERTNNNYANPGFRHGGGVSPATG